VVGKGVLSGIFFRGQNAPILSWAGSTCVAIFRVAASWEGQNALDLRPLWLNLRVFIRAVQPDETAAPDGTNLNEKYTRFYLVSQSAK
jgi:hypothetical protein